ncbi:hypothetical protein BG006_001326 [Podila minutissima]|uniref:Nucleoporin Nup188 N-terminal domain-containing protein n=1 Tax=Podila minutissima TaxID=64525 RepID=A0A9P5VH58_9FUNG|nr:hypothetical protein BG006_001326 [Podila minutissima]
MSFIFSLFSDNATTTEKANKAALEAVIRERNIALKAECSLFEHDYKQAVQAAEHEYRRAVEQAKSDMFRDIFAAVKRDVDTVVASEEYCRADAKTRAKIDSFQAWMFCAADKHLSENSEMLFESAKTCH